MNKRKIRTIYLQTAAGLILLSLGQCRSVSTVNSVRVNQPITIDADLSDWKGTTSSSVTRFFDIGIANDDSSLFVGMKSTDPEAIHQVIRSGLTLWFENDNSSYGRMGIRFPTGSAGSGRMFRQSRPVDEDNSEGHKMLGDVIEVIGPNKQDTVPMKLSIAESFGLNLKTSLSPANFIYELRIPFHSDSEDIDATIPVLTGSNVTIDIESPQIRFTSEGGNRFAENHRTGELFGSGQSNFPGSPGRPRNGTVNDGNQEPAEPFSIKLRVKLEK